MGRVQHLREMTRDAWQASIRHRFVDELLTGTLSDDVLAHYLVQDYQFIDAYTAMLGQACASAPTFASRLPYAEHLGVVAADEDTYFVDTFDELGVSADDRVSPTLTPAARAFDDLMRATVTTRSYAACLGVLWVAEALYLDWGQRADHEDIPTLAPKHQRWIDLHRGPEFASWVAWLEQELDALPLSADDERMLEDHVTRAVDCEVAFFDAAYDI